MDYTLNGIIIKDTSIYQCRDILRIHCTNSNILHLLGNNILPHQWNTPIYGQKQQLAHQTPPLPQLSKQHTTRIQATVGTFLYYARSLDHTILVASNSLGTTQSKPTKATNISADRLLDYLATHPEPALKYTKSGMVLYVDSDAAYLVEPGAKSGAGGYYYLVDYHNPKINGHVYYFCTLIKTIMSSAAESELDALFLYSTTLISIRHVLKDTGNPQPPAPIKTGNTTALGVVTDTIKRKRTKAMDTRFHWVRNRMGQNQIKVY